ncbi:MAG: glutathione peroxidase [Planctomycetes bacterium]|nr:glutathione peroxidase [Planctomycetota bacterium]
MSRTLPLAFALLAPLALAASATIYDLSLEDLEGQPFDARALRGKVVLVVNTASRCGLTPQYEQLEALHRRFKDRGLVVLGVPSNDFGAQEPGTPEEIREFCARRFEVSFPLLAKAKVTGDEKCLLYRLLTESEGHAGEVRWNFTKFLVDRDGRVVGRFEPRVAPDDPALVAAVERALGEAR